MPNTFSPTWYSTFLDPIAPEQTGVEMAFITRHIPIASHPTVLDVCCGPGRHAGLLIRHGYRVTGVDTNAEVLDRARRAVPGASFHEGDMRDLRFPERSFDAAINLWQSFGYFDDAVNAAVLRGMRDVVRPGGRAIVDIYNRDHFAQLPLSERSVRNGVGVLTTRTWNGPRMTVTLSYDTGGGDVFDWRLYSPREFRALARGAGWDVRAECAWFTDTLQPGPEHARMQFVLERPEG